MHKALVQMNIQLPTVIADVAGASSQAILRAIVESERDGHQLAALCDVRIKAGADEIATSLQGHWRGEHLFALKQALAAFDFCGVQLAECDARWQVTTWKGRLERPHCLRADVVFAWPTPT